MNFYFAFSVFTVQLLVEYASRRDRRAHSPGFRGCHSDVRPPRRRSLLMGGGGARKAPVWLVNGAWSLACSVDERKRMILVRVGHFFSLSLSQGSNAHISSSSRPASLVLLRLSNLRFYKPFDPPCTSLSCCFFSRFACFIFLFFFLSALTSNHLTRNEWLFERDCAYR